MKRDFKWIFTITLLAFLITILFTLGSQSILKDVNIVVGIIIILVFILLGVLFDIVGVAVQSSEEQSFHAMASKKVKGAKTANKMLQNSDKVSSFCNDVICGIVSGSAGLVVAIEISNKLGCSETIVTLLTTSIIAALTIGGKAIGKGFAVNESEYIVSKVTKFLNIFDKK